MSVPRILKGGHKTQLSQFVCFVEITVHLTYRILCTDRKRCNENNNRLITVKISIVCARFRFHVMHIWVEISPTGVFPITTFHTHYAVLGSDEKYF